jgi:uncharacterized protein YndB with AHSA1/START domain
MDELVINRRIFIGAPAEEVWRWLVEPELSRQYSLADLFSRPNAPGDPMQYFSKLGSHLLIDGEVEEIVEGRKLVHTFQFQSEEPEPQSRVSYELLRYGEAMCCLELRHAGFEPDSDTFRSVSSSWDVLLSSLKTLVETGRPLPWPRRNRG